MRVATFNIESLQPVADDGTTLDQRAEILRPQFARLRADVLCLQEINGQRKEGGGRELSALEQLLSGTPYQGFHIASSTRQNGAGVADVHNLVTLSRWPIAETKSIRNHLVPAIKWKFLNSVPPASAAAAVELDRPVLMTRIAIGEDRFLVVLNVHFRAPLAAPIPGQKETPFVWKSVRAWSEGYFLSALKRSSQALELRLLVEDILDANLHSEILVCGDFNAEDHETPLKLIVASEEDTGSGLLAARSLAVLDRSIPRDRRFSVLHHGRRQMLDHIVVSRSLLGRFRQVEVHNETLSDELVSFTRVQRPLGSHHAPLVAEFDSP